jgi:hypothetical protein
LRFLALLAVPRGSRRSESGSAGEPKRQKVPM